METIRKTKIYQEFDAEISADWFSYTPKKFITHIDNLYYSVKLDCDITQHLGWQTLVNTIKTLRDQTRKTHNNQPFMEDDIFCDLEVRPYGSNTHHLGISRSDKFDIFFSEHFFSADSTEILVQIRAENIWLSGLDGAYYESLVYLYTVLDRYDIPILKITENRIDFAWHTNYIQNMLNFFKTDNLPKMAVHNFKRGEMGWKFKEDDTLEVDYLAFGRRKSNSSFFRIYNKSQEVIEQGYKQFFVHIWLENGLISKFDKYVFDMVFDRGKCSWNYKEVARCLFYLEHGKDASIKADIRKLLNYFDSSTTDYKKIADLCVPDLTNVVNLEMETHRDFTREFVLPKIEFPDWLPEGERRMYKVLRCIPSMRDFIVKETIRFVNFKGEDGELRRDRRPTADWWLRLSAAGGKDEVKYALFKDYQKWADGQKMKNRMVTGMANYSAFSADDNGIDVKDDWYKALTRLNDNDIQRYEYQRGKKQKEFQGKYDGDCKTVTKDFWEGLVL